MRLSSQRRSHFESLEPRQHASVTLPEDGRDIHLSLTKDQTVVQTTSPSPNARQSAAGFNWYYGGMDVPLFQATNNKLQLADCSLAYTFAGTDRLWANRYSEPDEAAVRYYTRQAVDSGAKILVVDNEVWRFDLRYAPRAEVDSSIRRMTKVLQWMHAEAPEIKIGVYGYLSQSDDDKSVIWPLGQSGLANGNGWWQAMLPGLSSGYAAWQASSEYLRPLSKYVDYVFPSLYTGTTRIGDWKTSAKATIEDSRRFGKPVIPFLMPFYHTAVPGVGGNWLPDEMWQAELDWVHEYADGGYVYMMESTTPNPSWATTFANMVISTTQQPLVETSAPLRANSSAATHGAVVAAQAMTPAVVDSTAARASRFFELGIDEDQSAFTE